MTRWCKCGGIQDFIGTSMHNGLSEDYQCRECDRIDEIHITPNPAGKQNWFDQMDKDESYIEAVTSAGYPYKH